MTLWVCPEYQTVPAWGYSIGGEYTSRISTGEAPVVASDETVVKSAAAMVMNFMVGVGVFRERRKRRNVLVSIEY